MTDDVDTGAEYAVTPTFEHWRFPHDNLPSSWQTIANFNQISRPPDDTSCRLTQHEDSVESAHLVPASQKEWFDTNIMYDYVPSTATDKMKHASNMICLRSDIHTIFDAKRFAIVPMEKRLVAYCFNEEPGSQVECLYHGVELHRLRVWGHFNHFLLARFAYTVFEHLRGFLDANVSRMLRLRLQNDWITQLCDRDKCQAYARATASQGKSRSVSPKKRPWPQGAEERETVEDDWSDEEETRGRKRHRTNEYTCWPPSASFTSTYPSISEATPEGPLLPTH
jgi:HNH endonuclease